MSYHLVISTTFVIISLSVILQCNCLVPALDSPVFNHESTLTLSRNKRYSKATDDPERETCGPGVAAPITRVSSNENLKRLRKLMQKEKIDAYIIPRADEHNGEYTAKYDQRRSWITGFDGSNGDAVVLKDAAAVWTDGRYFLQAEEQLDCSWTLMKLQVPGVPNITTWLINRLRVGSNVAADPKLILHQKWLDYKTELLSRGLNLVASHDNLIDKIWTHKQGRPKAPSGKLFIHDKRFSGQTWIEKLKQIRIRLIHESADGIVISALDDIAWTFNLRGSDVPFLPVFKSYAFIGRDMIKLYVDLKKIGDDVKQHLKSDGCTSKNCVVLVNYDDIWMDLKETINHMSKIFITSTASFALYDTVSSNKRVVVPSPIVDMKQVKNPTEIEGMKNAHIRDSAAIVDFVSMLEEEVQNGKHWDELKAADALAKIRGDQQFNRGESFETISAFASNGAVIHYKPNKVTNKRIDTSNMYLLDSGGQYLDGTTDITRTFHFGEPTDFHKETYTRVLMGSIDLARFVFPRGVTDRHMDIMARKHLYEIGLDYNHGTGHGIGVFSNIHEPVISIRKPTPKKFGLALSPGMFLSDEPGFYEDRSFGVRLETIVMVKNMSTPNHFNHVPYYGFESIALVPFEPNLIKYQLLSKDHVDWLNEYHDKCRRVVGDLLTMQGKQKAFDWLRKRTEPIAVNVECQAKPVVATPQKQCETSSANRVSVSIVAFVFLTTSFIFAV